jgi:hypothetical protein
MATHQRAAAKVCVRFCASNIVVESCVAALSDVVCPLLLGQSHVSIWPPISVLLPRCASDSVLVI